MGQFICGECFEEMKKMSDRSINFIFTSPPYADQITDYGKTGVMIKPVKFCHWFLPRPKEMFRILKDDGSFVLNISFKDSILVISDFNCVNFLILKVRPKMSKFVCITI